MKNKIVIIDYRMGNIASVEKIFKKFYSEVYVSNDKEEIEKASHLVLPGVGAFGDGIKNIREMNLADILQKKVVQDKTPFLGICLGMQLLADKGKEHGNHNGLGWIPATVKKLTKRDGIRIPHVGWNDACLTRDSKLFQGIDDLCFYFVHSYALEPEDNSVVTSYCEYGDKFVSSLQKDNIFATQFHPEKSQNSGLKLIENFLDYQYA